MLHISPQKNPASVSSVRSSDEGMVSVPVSCSEVGVASVPLVPLRGVWPLCHIFPSLFLMYYSIISTAKSSFYHGVKKKWIPLQHKHLILPRASLWNCERGFLRMQPPQRAPEKSVINALIRCSLPQGKQHVKSLHEQILSQRH